MTTMQLAERPQTAARWEDALDAQLEAYLFATSERGKRYLDGWVRSSAEGSATRGEHKYADWLKNGVGSIASILFNAEPIHVDPDMQTLWQSAAPHFVEEALQESDLLTDSGFIYLPKPHEIVDIHGKTVNHRAFLWTRMLDGIAVFMLHRVGDVDGYDTGSAFQFPNVMRSYGDGTTNIKRGDLIVDSVYPWKFGSSPTYEGREPGTPATHDMQVLLRLMNQTITTKTAGRPNRPTRRRMQRAAFPERSIVIVRLRRPSAPRDDDSETRTVEWSHRWLVSGHWRNQWFPSLGVHRQIYISPFVKGPDDKPLEVRKTRVFDWSR